MTGSISTTDTLLVTGGAGFIGSNFVLSCLKNTPVSILNLDLLTYAGNPANLAEIEDYRRYSFVQGDICDRELVAKLLSERRPRAIVHFAAESHVDRSIVSPEAFVRTNVLGTLALLEQAQVYWSGLDDDGRAGFRFLHVSTDEAYGSLGPNEPAFTESSPYVPNSPYAASKAASDHLVRAFHRTYGLPALVTNSTNNYGPFQFPEKLVPLMILNALEGRPLPVYGDGKQVRDWLQVEDHCAALLRALEAGRPGESYNIGAHCERTNLDVVTGVCDLVDEMRPRAGAPRRNLIEFVEDRPGHDRRCAVDAGKIGRELGWKPATGFEDGLRRTVRWYLDHQKWVAGVQTGAYREWTAKNYSERRRI